MSRQACVLGKLAVQPPVHWCMGMLCLGLSVQVMLNGFVTSLLQRVAGTDDADVLEAWLCGYFSCSCAIVSVLFLMSFGYILKDVLKDV